MTTSGVRWADGERAETLGASTGLRDVEACPPGVIALSDGEHQVAVWRFPLDPGLPGLAAACDPPAISALLGSFGVPDQPVSLKVRAYRPRRRAVIEVCTPEARLFVNVLRPSKVAGLHHRHRLLHDAGMPVPQSVGWSDDGLLVLAALTGQGLRERLRGGGQVPTGADLLALLDAMPADVLDLPRRTPWAENVVHYAGVVGAALPAEADRATLAGPAPAPVRLHRDLHDRQVLVVLPVVPGVEEPAPGSVGMLDFDLAAAGDAALDLANLLVHLDLRVLQGHTPRARARACAEALIDGYGPVPNVSERLCGYARLTRLRLVGVYAFRPEHADTVARLVTDSSCRDVGDTLFG